MDNLSERDKPPLLWKPPLLHTILSLGKWIRKLSASSLPFLSPSIQAFACRLSGLDNSLTHFYCYHCWAKFLRQRIKHSLKVFVMLLKEDKEPCFHDQVVTMTESFAPIKVPNTMFFFSDSLRHFSFSPKFQKFQLEIKWNRPFCFGLTGIFGNTFEDGPLWPAWSFQLVGPKCPLPFDKIVVCLQEQQPNVRRLGFDCVGATGMYPGFAQSWKVLEF